MKKIFFSLLILVGLVACTSTENKDKAKAPDQPMTLVDSLLQQVEEGHDVGMAKIGKLHISKEKVQHLIDSISKLPAKTQDAAKTYVAKLKEAISDLDYADMAMDKWMTEYEPDSAIGNKDQRLVYLQDEAMKVNKVKAAILNSMQKADSLLKAKF